MEFPGPGKIRSDINPIYYFCLACLKSVREFFYIIFQIFISDYRFSLVLCRRHSLVR